MSPIRRHIDGIIDAAIKPALEDSYEIIVSHKISEPGSITKQIISEIYNDDLVIANLTDRNPNVMYELAFRHTIGKPVIMIAEKGTNIPSDIIMQRTIFYHNDAKGVLELKDALTKAKDEIKFDDPCGPIFDILGDISHDTSVLQKARQINDNEIEPLEYILMRLNTIEDAVRSNQDLRNLKKRVEEHDEVVFRYTEISNHVNIKTLKRRLSLVNRIDPDVLVRDVRIDNDNKIVIIHISFTGLIAIPEIYQYFLKVLSEHGFKELDICNNFCRFVNE